MSNPSTNYHLFCENLQLLYQMFCQNYYGTFMQEHFIEIFTKEAMKARQEANTDSNELQYKDLCKFIPYFLMLRLPLQ